MEEQFVTYEIALKLKELGFDEPCLAFYDANKNIILGQKPEYMVSKEKVDYIFGSGNIKVVLAPLWQQVIDWIREKHDIDIYPEPTYSLTDYSFKIITVQGKAKRQIYWDGMNKTYKSYKEAREQAILKAIELCQKD